MIRYKTRPDQSNALPSGIPYIVGNEAAERFSYYGMRAILVIFMTQYLMNTSGQPDVMQENEAQGYFHLFVSTVYFMPLFGALLADGLLGKYRTIIVLSLLYCLGHFALAIDNTRMGLLIGQGLIAMGAEGIKPCVSAHIGDQFGAANRHLPCSLTGYCQSIRLGLMPKIAQNSRIKSWSRCFSEVTPSKFLANLLARWRMVSMLRFAVMIVIPDLHEPTIQQSYT